MEDIHNTLEACKTASLLAENINYLPRLNFDIEYLGRIYQADEKSYLALIAASSQLELPNDFYWLDKNNNKVLMTKSELQGLVSVVFLHRLKLFNEHQQRKERFRAAASIEELFVDVGLPPSTSGDAAVD